MIYVSYAMITPDFRSVAYLSYQPLLKKPSNLLFRKLFCYAA